MQTEYEVIFIFESGESAFKASLEKVKKLFADKQVEITHEDDMGQRKLAYEINHHNDGHYYVFRILVDGLVIKDLKADLQLYEDIIRFMLVKLVFKKKRYKDKEAGPVAV